ncbi:thioredoxin domain-containing protein 3 isoform X2 [Tachyglossus aculeatus]|uniref:thioredoxin domain-containing protein 3 isoform X2 n=1 Tax=Tachyglossus aculeatus TaxID=9261 RepID=UPI0018F4AE31|nr:thioredoxin domain-containing protein 3 isoform X2 [Tachyglossus aculeatus]
MASKKKEVQLQTVINNQNLWNEMLLNKGLTVIDVYQAWCGPCKAVQTLFRKLKNELAEDELLHFAVAEADNILTLQPFRDKCEPVFLFCVGNFSFQNGKIISMVRGANAPLINKTIIEIIEDERKIEAGIMVRPELQELVFMEMKDSNACAESRESLEDKYTVAIIKPDAVADGRVEEVKQKIKKAGFVIAAEAERTLSEEQVRDFYNRKAEQPDFEEFVKFMLSGPSHILIISQGKRETTDIPHWTELMDFEPTNESEQEGHGQEPSLQEALASQQMATLCDIEDSVENASRQLAFFFPEFSKAKKTGLKVEKTLALIRPDLLKKRRDSVLRRIREDGFTIAMEKEIVLTKEQAHSFYKEHENEDFFPVLLEHMTSGPTLALALVRENAVQRWRDLLGPKVVENAKEEKPESLRAQFAVENVAINQLHGSSSLNEAKKELNFFFPCQHTLAIIKPDALPIHKEKILQTVHDSGFIISQMKETHLTREMATQFYKAHEGKEFLNQLVDYMSEGPSMVMILSKNNAVEDWRKLMGPTDPEEAKRISPNSLRAQLATSILKNAVHGSSNKKHAWESIAFLFGDIDLENQSQMQDQFAE